MYLGGGTKGDVNSMVTGKSANNPNLNSSTNVKKIDTAKLFRENLKFGSMPVQPLGSSTVFHAGIIGGGGGKNAVMMRRGGVGTPAAGEVETCAETEMELREHVTGVLLRLCRACGDEVRSLASYLGLQSRVYFFVSAHSGSCLKIRLTVAPAPSNRRGRNK